MSALPMPAALAPYDHDNSPARRHQDGVPGRKAGCFLEACQYRRH